MFKIFTISGFQNLEKIRISYLDSLNFYKKYRYLIKYYRAEQVIAKERYKAE